MFTKHLVSPYHHTLLSAKTSYKILFSYARSYYLRLVSYFNVYSSFHIQFIYFFKYPVVKLYLNLCISSVNKYFFSVVVVGKRQTYCFLVPHMCVCNWTLVRWVCPNYEVVEFQPLTVTPIGT